MKVSTCTEQHKGIVEATPDNAIGILPISTVM